MGLLRIFHRSHGVPQPHHRGRKGAASRTRICRFEQIEARQLLSATVPALNVGATYYQPYDGNDSIGSLFYISWNGGAAGTQLTDLYIDTHKVTGGTPQFTVTDPADGDVFFHIAPSSVAGTMQGVPPQVVEWSGTVQPVITVSNDSTLLHIQFASQDFQSSGRLVLKVNVDIMQSWSGGVATRVVEGADFDGTSFEAVFAAPGYQTATVEGFFRNVYANPVTTYGLNLPDDNYDNSSAIFTTGMPPATPPDPVFTAGVLASMEQTPLPITLSGTVFEDMNADNIQESGDPGIAGVTLTLNELDDSGDYVPTGSTATTDANGNYEFDGLLPGTYQVVETQPAGYLSVGDTPGTVNGQTRGVVTTVDILSGINLDGGDNSIQNDFAETLPAGISGQVYVDLNGDGTLDPGDTLLPGVTIYLLDSGGNQLTSTTTDANGKYSFSGLTPGVYGVQEIQPAGYLEGGDQVGSAGGALDGYDRILSAQLGAGVYGQAYDFYEVLPAKISGYVFQDGPAIVLNQNAPVPNIPAIRNGILTPDDLRLPGITLQLCDATGYPLSDSSGNPITTTTDANGYYEFTGLRPGVYSIVEAQPSQYVPGVDTAGSKGGLVVDRYATLNASILSTLAVDPSGAAIVQIPIKPGDVAVEYNFSEVLIQRQPNGPPGGPTPSPPIPLLPPPPPSAFAMYEPPGRPYYALPLILSQPTYGGGSAPSGYTWHLSVIDAGQPRGDSDGDELSQSVTSGYFDPVSWTGPDLGQSQWVLADQDGTPIKTLRFGVPGATPVTGDWDGSGVTKIGVFLDGLWFLDLNGNGIWDENDLWIKLGKKGDQPVAGDWDGDGKTDIGIFGPQWNGDLKALAADPGLPNALNPPAAKRPKNVPPDPADAAAGYRTMKKGHAGRMRSDVIDHVFQYGRKGDVAVVGDWNGDGIYSIGIFRDGTWYLDIDGDGRWSDADAVVEFGQPGDVPVVGDWTGDGISKLGVYRNGKFILDTNNNRQLDANDKVIELGGPGDKPVVGDWTGDGVDKVGVYRDSAPAETPLQAARQ